MNVWALLCVIACLSGANVLNSLSIRHLTRRIEALEQRRSDAL